MNGSTLWYLQRFSSILILIYVIYIAYFILGFEQISYITWMQFVETYLFKISTSLTFLIILTHSYIGLWTVGTDYLTSRTLGFLSMNLSEIANSSRLIYNVFFSGMGIILYIYLLFLVWI